MLFDGALDRLRNHLINKARGDTEVTTETLAMKKPATPKAEKPKYHVGDEILFKYPDTIASPLWVIKPIIAAVVDCVSDCGKIVSLIRTDDESTWWSDLTDIDVVGVVRAPKQGEIFAETTFRDPVSVDDVDILSVIYSCGRRDGTAQKMGEDIKTPSELYNDLIYCVDQRIPGETRHETAKRWLTERITLGTAHSDAKPVVGNE